MYVFSSLQLRANYFIKTTSTLIWISFLLISVSAQKDSTTSATTTIVTEVGSTTYPSTTSEAPGNCSACLLDLSASPSIPDKYPLYAAPITVNYYNASDCLYADVTCSGFEWVVLANGEMTYVFASLQSIDITVPLTAKRTFKCNGDGQWVDMKKDIIINNDMLTCGVLSRSPITSTVVPTTTAIETTSAQATTTETPSHKDCDSCVQNISSVGTLPAYLTDLLPAKLSINYFDREGCLYANLTCSGYGMVFLGGDLFQNMLDLETNFDPSVLLLASATMKCSALGWANANESIILTDSKVFCAALLNTPSSDPPLTTTAGTTSKNSRRTRRHHSMTSTTTTKKTTITSTAYDTQGTLPTQSTSPPTQPTRMTRATLTPSAYDIQSTTQPIISPTQPTRMTRASLTSHTYDTQPTLPTQAMGGSTATSALPPGPTQTSQNKDNDDNLIITLLIIITVFLLIFCILSLSFNVYIMSSRNRRRKRRVPHKRNVSTISLDRPTIFSNLSTFSGFPV